MVNGSYSVFIMIVMHSRHKKPKEVESKIPLSNVLSYIF